jgi:hypothetical protein
VYSELDELEKALCGRAARSSRSRRPDLTRPDLARMVALHLSFVASPDGSRELSSELALAVEQARLSNEGLEASLLLVSDREARLVTLVTFWESRRFLPARESCIAWMQKLLAPFADGSIRAHTSVPQFLGEEASVRGAVDPLALCDRMVEHLAAG